jgi:hypothetical protein
MVIKKSGWTHGTLRAALSSRADAALPPVPTDGDYECADYQTRAQAKTVREDPPLHDALPRAYDAL